MRSDDRQTRILLLDASELMRIGLRMVLSRESWVERCVPAATAEHALRIADDKPPDVAIVGLSLGHTAATATGALLAARGCRVLLLSSGQPLARSVLSRAHATAVVDQRWSAKDMASAVRQAAHGEPPAPAAPIVFASPISHREHDVLQLVATGATNREIGRRLYLSPHTVKQHTSALYRKLGARNRADAVQRAQRLGLLDPVTDTAPGPRTETVLARGVPA